MRLPSGELNAASANSTRMSQKELQTLRENPGLSGIRETNNSLREIGEVLRTRHDAPKGKTCWYIFDDGDTLSRVAAGKRATLRDTADFGTNSLRSGPFHL